MEKLKLLVLVSLVVVFIGVLLSIYSMYLPSVFLHGYIFTKKSITYRKHPCKAPTAGMQRNEMRKLLMSTLITRQVHSKKKAK
jgi:hypothetical protein